MKTANGNLVLLVFLLIAGFALPATTFGLIVDAPQAKDDVIVINEDQSPYIICVIDNDLDGSAINTTPGEEATPPFRMPVNFFNVFSNSSLVSSTTQVTDASCTGATFNALQIVLVPNASGNDSTEYGIAGSEGVSDTSTGVCFAAGDDTQSCGKVILTVNPVNDAPVVTVPSGQTLNEDELTAILGISVVDVDADGGPGLTVTLTLLNGTVNVTQSGSATVSNNNSAMVSVSGSVADVSNTIATSKYTSDLNYNGADVLTVNANDGGNTGSGGTETDIETISITVSAVNDAPTVVNAIADVNTSEDASNTVISLTNVIADVDIATNSDTLTMTVTDNTNSSLFDSVTLSDASADAIINDTLTLDYAADQNGTTDITITATDSIGALTITETFSVTVSAVNDNPVISSNGAGATISVSVAENQTTVTTVAADDVDVGDGSSGVALSFDLDISAGADHSFFSIGAASGVLTFSSSPDFETKADNDGDGVYEVTVRASDDEGLTDTQFISVTVTDKNDHTPSITSSATATVAENQTSAIDVDASDADGTAANNTITYSLTGGAADNLLFNIVAGTGLVTFKVAPDFDAPSDADADNIYNIEVKADDVSADGALSSTQAIAITLTDKNDNTPLIVSSATASVTENQTSAIDVDASDADGTVANNTITYTLGGAADDLLFNIVADTGVVTFKAAPDFESPLDAGAGNTYNIQVKADDASADGALSSIQAIVITVTDNNDHTPLIVSSPTASVAENQTGAIDVDASDADGTAANNTITYTLTGVGADDLLFNIVSGTGLVTFKVAPDFESPSDADADNIYNIEVKADDAPAAGALSSTQAITITLTSVNDNTPVLKNDVYTLDEGAAINKTAGLSGTGVLGNDSDADLPGDALTVSVNASTSYGVLTLNVDGSFSYAHGGSEDLSDTFTYTVFDGSNTSAVATVTLTMTSINDNAPVVSNDGATFTIDENSAAGASVGTVIATDVDTGEALSYAITAGDPASVLSINSATGEITVASFSPEDDPLNFEETPSYTLTVDVTDSVTPCSPAAPCPVTTSSTFTVNLSNINDPPGKIRCETFVGGVDQGNVDARLKTHITFSEASPCHRIMAWTPTPLYFMEQAKELISTTAPLPTDTASFNYVPTLLDKVLGIWDEDSADTLYFSEKTLVTDLNAAIAVTDENGAKSTAITQEGGFFYQPPAGTNVTDDGVDSFVYRVCDHPTNTGEANCALGIVEVQIDKAPVAAVSSGNQITFTEDLSQSPLELPVPAIPNVLVLLDDSESMQSDLMTDEAEGLYIADGKTKNYFFPGTDTGGSNFAEKEVDDPGKGLWRLRNSTFNKIYYNPAITYAAWSGLDNADTEFGNQDPTAAKEDPYRNNSKVHDFTKPAEDQDLAYYFTWVDIDDAFSCPGNVVGVVDGASPITAPGGACTEGALVEIKSAADGGSDTYPKGTARTDCVTSASTCTYAEEIQNFANFYSYHRTRHATAKAALGGVIATAENLRVGLGAFGGNSDNFPIVELNESPLTGVKEDLLDHLNRTAASSNSTPIRTTLEDAGEYFACNSGNLMFGGASSPGDVTCPYLAAPEGNCQSSFALLVTAGFWNGVDPGLANADGDGILTAAGSGSSDFDGGRYADSAADTLADVAMYYYETDLHASLVNEVPTMSRDTAGAPASGFGGNPDTMHQHMKTYVITFGVTGSIALADVPTDITTSFAWGDSLTDDEKLNDLVHTAVNGRGDYLNANNPTELQASLKSAFEEFSQASGTASAVSFNSQEIQAGSLVYRAFYNIRDNTGDLIAQNFDTTGSLGTVVWSAAEQLDVKDATDRVIITYDADAKQGKPFRHTASSRLTDEQRNALKDDPIGTMTATEIDDQVERFVNYLRGDATDERPSGNLRERPEEKGRLGDIVHSAPVFAGPPRQLRRNAVPYPQGSSYTAFRAAFENRESLVYTSANDGMMHGFDADHGEEKIAFMPNHVITGTYSQKAKQLLDFNYIHKYSNDLSPALNDVFIRADGVGAKQWKSIIIGGYGAGAKGYYAIDITDPTSFSEANANDVVLWEFTDVDDTYPTAGAGMPLKDGADKQLLDDHDNDGCALAVGTDCTPSGTAGLPFKDLGYTFSVPTIALSNVTDSVANGNEWVAIFGNGYNSSAGRAKMYVLFISKGTDGDWCHPDMGYNEVEETFAGTWGTVPSGCVGKQDFVKLDTGVGTINGKANGLGTPRGIDVDGNGTVDYAYAGDRFGNFYRFDLTDSDFTKWSVTRIFQATYDNNGVEETQPITTQPLVIKHPTEKVGADCLGTICGGFIIILATGSYHYQGDDTNADVQSLYGVWDKLGPVLIDKTELQMQEYTNLLSKDFDGDGENDLVRILSENPVDYGTQKGWFNNLDAVPAGGGIEPEFPGERAIRNIQTRSGLIFVNSVIPKSKISCTSDAGGAAHVFCPSTGTLICLGDAGVFDLNNDGLFNQDDETSTGEVVAGTFFKDAVPTDSSFIGGSRVTQLSNQTLQIMQTDTSGGDTGRISWKRLEK